MLHNKVCFKKVLLVTSHPYTLQLKAAAQFRNSE